MKITARFSGIVSYTDNSHQQFAGHLDERGNISVNSSSQSEEAIWNVTEDQSWLEDMLALLSGTIALSPGAGTAKTVRSMTAQISGHVAYDDNTHGGFIAEYSPKIGAFVPSGGADSNWAAALADSAVLAHLNTLFQTVAGTGSSVSA